MSFDSSPQFDPEEASKRESARTEQELNELIPILAHGLIRRIEQKGFAGKVRVQASAGETWGIGKSPDNASGIPNVIVYPRECLAGDKRLVNARLRHEIGNLNYPIDSEINDLRVWCFENKVAPELVTSLVEAVHEASVNYLEMRNSYSDQPEENFRALYEQEINTQQIANNISQSAPYKQAVDLTLLYSLLQTRLVPADQFEQALKNAHPAAREVFDKQTQSLLDQIVIMAVPKKQVQLVRDFLWPKFSKLVALSNEKTSQESKQEQRGESKETQEQELTSAEKQEQKEEENLLAANLQAQIDQIKKQLEKLQKPGQQSETPKTPAKPPSIKEIGKQAEHMKERVEKAIQENKEDGAEEEQLQKLKEQLEQLEEVAEQISKTEDSKKEGESEDELEKYNIKEYGINEANLTPEQLEQLEKARSFAKNTSKTYRTTMRLLMKNYQQGNPNFTDKLLQKIMEHGYDVPDFSIYGSVSAQEFLSNQSELRIDSFSDNFLVNFQLPKPFAKFWYKGGDGAKSVPVKDGEIEWGLFYRMTMPVIYRSVTKASINGLQLDRLNEFGQHDPKKYYYLWEAKSTEKPASVENEKDDEKGPGEGDSEHESESESDEKDGDDGGDGEKSENNQSGGGQSQSTESGESSSDSESEQDSGQGSGEETGKEAGGETQSGQSGEKMEAEGESGKEKVESGKPGKEESSGGQPSVSAGESGEESSGQFKEGNQGNNKSVEDLFRKPGEKLFKELKQSETMLGSKFSKQDENGNLTTKKVEAVTKNTQAENTQFSQQLKTLEDIKRQQQAQIESKYREMSGLDGEALRIYIDYMESTKDFTNDLIDFFIEKFKLDKDYVIDRNQRRGARLQRGFIQNILGSKDGRVVISPNSFERKRLPEKPQFAWTLIIDNSGSCAGETIEQEKKLAVALVEVAKKLDIPLEIITFGGPDEFIFLKAFDQEISGDDLQKLVLLNADQGTPDVVTLEAACLSMEKFADKFKRSYNFVYFMTDGESGEGSIEAVIKKHKKNMVITGIGMADAAQTIAQTWGRNAVEVPDVEKLSDAFIRKVEDQIDSTFD